jgi:hypothetical protein
MAKRTYTWMPTKEGGSKATTETRNDGLQGWLVQPLIIAGTTYFQLQHCAVKPDHNSSTEAWTLMTRALGIKSSTKRTAEPLNPRIGQGCSFSLTDVMNAAQWFSMNELIFETAEDAQTFAEETREFSLTTVCI